MNETKIMKLFIVTREGVYRHEIIGVFSTLTSAKEWALSTFMAEKDRYHSVHVLERELDAWISPELYPGTTRAKWNEPEPVFVIDEVPA